MEDCEYREVCDRLGGLCQCAEEREAEAEEAAEAVARAWMFGE
jgi:hypothetical protein